MKPLGWLVLSIVLPSMMGVEGMVRRSCQQFVSWGCEGVSGGPFRFDRSMIL